MFSKEKIEIALRVYHQCGSLVETIRILGYPARTTLYNWIAAEGPKEPENKLPQPIDQHPYKPSPEVKIEAVRRCFVFGENVTSVSKDMGYSRNSIYTWRKKYSQGETALLMDDKKIVSDAAAEDSAPNKAPTIEELQKKIDRLELKVAIFEEVINVLKKDPGVNLKNLKNREKAVIVDALRNRFPLPLMLEELGFAKSCYYYWAAAFKRADKYSDERRLIIEIFHANHECYGYRRIYGKLKEKNIILSEKVVRRIMKAERLVVPIKRKKKFSTYLGELSPAVPNLVQRNFHAEQPNKLWLTDVTEFSLPSGKVYLSPILDCFDGMLPAWSISTKADSHLANSMLDKAIATLKDDEKPIIHSDRGNHYRWPSWIERMEAAGLTRSMSMKGCSPDNAACEGLFGRIKNEMFYNRDWSGVSISEFITILNDYLIWYNEKRIKVSLNYMSPVQYRRSLSLAA